MPINVAYNHHFEASITGAKSRAEFVRLSGPDDPRGISAATGHRKPVDALGRTQVIVDLDPSAKVPTHVSTGAGNGGEYRKSFHGFPPGYALAVDSPDTWHITPMQIDTWNREKMPLTGDGPFVPGPLPQSALSPGSRNVPAKHEGDAMYSGLLECPVTTRVIKHVDSAFARRHRGRLRRAVERDKGVSHERRAAAAVERRRVRACGQADGVEERVRAHCQRQCRVERLVACGLLARRAAHNSAREEGGIMPALLQHACDEQSPMRRYRSTQRSEQQ